MANRAADWLRQAVADLEHAQTSLDHFYHLHGDPWGHSLLALLEGLIEPARASVTRELLDSARALDKQYIATRYPNGFAQGAPTDYYTKRDAEESIAHAQSILSFCQAAIRQPEPGAGAGEDDGESDRGRAS